MASYKMNVQKRQEIGSNKVNKLRAEKKIPAVIYKRGEETESLQVDLQEFQQTFRKAGTTSIIELNLDGEVRTVIVKDVQTHPVRPEILHIDFQELNMDEKLKVLVPIHLLNRDQIKVQPSVLTQLLNEIEVECLPGNIPNSADLDVSGMDFDTPLFVRDVDIAKDEDIEILMDYDTVVCTLTEPMEEEEEEEELEEGEEADAADVPVIGEDEEEEE